MFLAIINEIIKQGLFDRDFLINYTNSAELVNMDEKSSEHGMFVRFEVPKEEGCFDAQNKLWWDRDLEKPISMHTEGSDPYLFGEFKLDDGTPVKTAFQLLVDRVKDYTPEWAEKITGISAETIKRLAYEMGITAT